MRPCLVASTSPIEAAHMDSVFGSNKLNSVEVSSVSVGQCGMECRLVHFLGSVLLSPLVLHLPDRLADRQPMFCKVVL